MIKPVY